MTVNGYDDDALSGDTGPAAIAGVKVCPNLHISVLCPFGRVSEIQELQMITVIAENVQVYRTEGNTSVSFTTVPSSHPLVSSLSLSSQR